MGQRVRAGNRRQGTGRERGRGAGRERGRGAGRERGRGRERGEGEGGGERQRGERTESILQTILTDSGSSRGISNSSYVRIV